MAQTAKDLLIERLSDAYRIESQALGLTETHIERLEHYPELQARVRQHHEESRQHKTLIEQCLNRLGASPSTLKETSISVMGSLQSLAASAAGEVVLKRVCGSYAFQHYEIAAYETLIALAEAAGEPEVARTCERILREEEAMAGWLREHLDDITRQFVARASAG